MDDAKQTLLILTQIKENFDVVELGLEWNPEKLSGLNYTPTNLKQTSCPKCACFINVIVNVGSISVKEGGDNQAVLSEIKSQTNSWKLQDIAVDSVLENDLKTEIVEIIVAKEEEVTHSEGEKFDDIIEESYYTEDEEFGSGAPNANQKENEKELSDETFLFECKTCNEKFRTDYSLRIHKNIHTNKFQCKICSKRFIKGERLKAHLRRNHTPEEQLEAKRLEIEESRQPQSKRDYTEKNVDNARESTERGTLCARCGKMFASTTLFFAHSQSAHKDLAYACPYCNKILRSRKTFKHHLIRAHTEKNDENLKYQCDLCDARYMLRRDLNMHLKMKHTLKEKKFKCEVCNEAFVYKRDLRDHFVKHIPDDRPLKCEICEKSFNRAYALKDHMLSHSHEKKHECYFCGQKYGRKAYLKVHERIHTGYRPYQCTRDECPAKFYDAGSYRQHRLMHERRDAANAVEMGEYEIMKIS